MLHTQSLEQRSKKGEGGESDITGRRAVDLALRREFLVVQDPMLSALLCIFLLLNQVTQPAMAMEGVEKLVLPVLRQKRFRYVSRVMYDGTGFKGWQTQDDGRKVRTVQEMIGKSLTTRFNSPISCTGASRTDLGVHARGQAIHFDLPQPCEDVLHLEFTMNRMLPDDVRLFNMTAVPLGTAMQVRDEDMWHATKSATGKLYVYRFCTNLYVDPIRRRYCTHIYQPTDIALLEKCLQVFVGTHDFQGYANKVACLTRLHEKDNKEFTTIRTVNSVRLVPDGEPGYYAIEFNLKSALYRMVSRSIILFHCVESVLHCR